MQFLTFVGVVSLAVFGLLLAITVVLIARKEFRTKEGLEASECQQRNKLLLEFGNNAFGNASPPTCITKDTCAKRAAGVEAEGKCVCDATKQWNGQKCMAPTPRPPADEARVLAGCRDRVMQFVNHLRTAHPNDPRARALFDRLKGVSLLPAEESKPNADGVYRNGKFGGGIIYIGPRDNNGDIRPWSSLCMTILHELAHAARIRDPGEDAHSQQWKDIWTWFVTIAAQNLGWQVEVKCSDCTFYSMCTRTQCPKCTWPVSACKPSSLKPL